jgi:RNA polymerase sigma-70 factor, ECF subfamily
MQSLGTRLAGGDEAAFAELYDATADRLYRFLSVRLGSSESAADVLQATFLRAVEKKRHFAKVDAPAAYLFRIAANEAARSIAAKRRSKVEQASLEMIAASDRELTQQDAEVVAAALARLEERERAILELKVYGGLTFREVAEALDLPQGTVATCYRRAIESLRPWLTKQLH